MKEHTETHKNTHKNIYKKENIINLDIQKTYKDKFGKKYL